MFRFTLQVDAEPGDMRARAHRLYMLNAMFDQEDGILEVDFEKALDPSTHDARIPYRPGDEIDEGIFSARVRSNVEKSMMIMATMTK